MVFSPERRYLDHFFVQHQFSFVDTFSRMLKRCVTFLRTIVRVTILTDRFLLITVADFLPLPKTSEDVKRFRLLRRTDTDRRRSDSGRPDFLQILGGNETRCTGIAQMTSLSWNPSFFNFRRVTGWRATVSLPARTYRHWRCTLPKYRPLKTSSRSILTAEVGRTADRNGKTSSCTSAMEKPTLEEEEETQCYVTGSDDVRLRLVTPFP